MNRKKKSPASALSGALCDWFCSQGNFCCPWAHEDPQMSVLCKFSTKIGGKTACSRSWQCITVDQSALAGFESGEEPSRCREVFFVRFPSCAFPAGVFKAKLTFRLMKKIEINKNTSKSRWNWDIQVIEKVSEPCSFIFHSWSLKQLHSDIFALLRAAKRQKSWRKHPPADWKVIALKRDESKSSGFTDCWRREGKNERHRLSQS